MEKLQPIEAADRSGGTPFRARGGVALAPPAKGCARPVGTVVQGEV